MINPGFETNLPTSSGRVDSALGAGGTHANLFGIQMGTKIFTLDGFTLTLGLLIVIIGVFWLWNTMFTRRRR